MRTRKQHVIDLVKTLLSVALAPLLYGLIATGASQQQTILGILEDVPPRYSGQSDIPAVRVAFQKRSTEWEASPAISDDRAELTWTIAFNGKNVGQLVTRNRKERGGYADIGLQDIISTGSVPTVGKRSEMYGGFLSTAVYRPLIANSQPYFEDPEGWKHAQLPPDLIAAVRRRFRQTFPKVTNCKNPEENVAKPWLYNDGNIKITNVYSSRKNWFVVQVLLEPYRCDGPQDDEFIDQWFVITPDDKITLFGRAMWLVDAGDYDNDGKSEIVFSIAGYDRGGYELFYNDFQKHATF
jgi:hypothetical protein